MLYPFALCCKNVLYDYKCKISDEEWVEYQVENNECSTDRIDTRIKENLKVRLYGYGMNFVVSCYYVHYAFFLLAHLNVFFGGDVSLKVMRTCTGVNYLSQTFFYRKSYILKWLCWTKTLGIIHHQILIVQKKLNCWISQAIWNGGN